MKMEGAEKVQNKLKIIVAVLVAMQISVTINQEMVNYWYDREL